MNFLNVFCFVLCLHTSVSTPSQNNARHVLHEQHEVADESPHIIQRISKDPLLKSIDITLESNNEKGRPVQNPARTIITRTLLRDLKHERTQNLQNKELATRSHYRARRPEDNVQSAYESGHLNQIKMYNKQNSPGPEPFETSVSISRDNVNRNLLRDDIRNNILPNTYKKREYFDSDMNGINDNNYRYQPSMKQLPFGPEETRLDLQGLSSEEVQSLTGTSMLGNPQERQLPSVINLNLDKDNILKSIPAHLMNKAKELHSIHAAAKKLKRYMIVHSNGTVEHTDNLEMVAEKYPNNYITIKSTDLEKYGQTSKAYNFPASVSERQSSVSSSNAHFPSIPLTQEETKQEVLSKTLENKDDDVIKSNAESALSAEKELPLRYNSSELVPKQDLTKNITSHTHIMRHENSVNKDLSIILKNSTVRPNTDKSLKGEDKNKDHISSSWNPVNLTEVKIDKSQSSDSSTKIHPPAIPLIQENIKQEVFHIPWKNKDEDVIKSNELSALSAIKELPQPNNSSETTSKQELTKKLTTHTHKPHENSLNKNLSIVLKNRTTIGPNTETNLKDIDKDKDINSLSWIPVNVTKDKTDNINITSSSPTPSLEDYSGVWFQDKDFWDDLKNAAQNVVYFFFVPPLPKVRKETKITLYPNGTKVEELTEIVDNEGGIPQALKTIKVTHAAEDAKT